MVLGNGKEGETSLWIRIENGKIYY